MKDPHSMEGKLCLTLLGFVASLFLSLDVAEGKETLEKPALSEEKGPAAPPPQAVRKSEKAQKEQEAAARLEGTEWGIELLPMAGERPKRPQKDRLRFEKGKIVSEDLSDDGYPTTNYTLTVGEDGSIVWETMQTKEGEGVVFWRGELQGEAMRGILSKHPTQGNAADFSFSGKLLKASPSGRPVALEPKSER